MTRKRRRFTAEFKKRVALEALRERDTVQAIASRYEVHPNQVSAWKLQAVEGLDGVFSAPGSQRGGEHEATIRDLHAKIGELTVERDFFCVGRRAEQGAAGRHDRPRLRAVAVPAVRASRREPVVAVLRAGGRERGEPGADAPAGRATPGAPVLRQPADGAASAPRGCGRRAAPGASADAADGMEAIYRRLRTSAANPEHRVYPYLLRDLVIDRSD